ncbi:putative protein, containings caspase domain [Nostoc flagelliforme CCNUN1]|uniref:Uncharacterized protein n=1 Tax=Nostoc flagelliforme CCNUN1 TaxID=2038116 RepID=A0A2K8SPL4_9NOSO|nr:hypothetical protein [Nostoc flagelliforme]AUB37290.1 putative protein, containings caspase domain [Nostoc flagelliforme CCNUN1]
MTKQNFKNGYGLLISVGADLPVTVKDVTAIGDRLIDSDRAAYFHTANRNLCNSAKYPRSF